MWIGDFPGDPSKALLLLDTEGLHDPQKEDAKEDVTIFTLAVFLSDIFVYNSMGKHLRTL